MSFSSLSRLHTLRDPSVLAEEPALKAALKAVEFPRLEARLADPLFLGTLQFANVQYRIVDQNGNLVGVYSVDETDIRTAIEYATLAVGPITGLVGQYGPGSLSVSSTILESPPYTTMYGASVGDLVNIVTGLSFWYDLSDNNCIVLIMPYGMPGPMPPGVLGFHWVAANDADQYSGVLPFIVVILPFPGTGFTIADEQDLYSVALSHEIAEMTVDPQANQVNPEVCDPCSGNGNPCPFPCSMCISWNQYVDYYQQDGTYIATRLAGYDQPPNSYGFKINAITQPQLTLALQQESTSSAAGCSPPGIGGYDLLDAAGRGVVFDYNGSGHLDHLVWYRPGAGAAWIVKRAGTWFFAPTYAQGTGGTGIGGYDLRSLADRVFAFDYDGSGKLDHLALYRPGTGTIWILKNTGGVFSPVYQQGDPGTGIGGYDLRSLADRVFAFDYDGSGKLDHLALYRPGTGTIWILKNTGGVFSPVYQMPAPSQVIVPDLVGTDFPTQTCNTMQGIGLTLIPHEHTSITAVSDTVVKQDHPAGSLANVGSLVNIDVELYPRV